MFKSARSDDSFSTYINELFLNIFIKHSKLRIARFFSFDLIFLFYVLLNQIKDVKFYELKIYKKVINDVYRKTS